MTNRRRHPRRGLEWSRNELQVLLDVDRRLVPKDLLDRVPLHTSLFAQHQQAVTEVRNLQRQLPKAHEIDRKNRGKALLHGKECPPSEAAKIQAQIDQSKRRQDDLAEAGAQIESKIVELSTDPEWTALLDDEIAASNARVNEHLAGLEAELGERGNLRFLHDISTGAMTWDRHGPRRLRVEVTMEAIRAALQQAELEPDYDRKLVVA